MTLGQRIRAAAAEIRRRRVWKLAALYCGGAVVLWEVADIAADALGAPTWVMPTVVWGTVAGLPVALVLGWLFDLTPRGVERTAPRGEGSGLATGVPAPLPSTATPLVDRDRELDGLLTLVSDPDVRLVSVVGPGGIGKTRLAIAAAEHMREREGGSAHFVALDEISAPDDGSVDAAALVAVIAAALGFRVPDPTMGAIAEALRGARVLVLDGPPPGAETVSLVDELLARVSGLMILVTGRSRLGARSEHVVALEGFAVGTPDGDEAAARLFALAARRKLPEFEPSAEDRHTIGEICRLLGGHPLAVELAGGWVDVLPLRSILEEIREGRHLELASPGTEGADGQSSLAVVVRGSFECLDPDVRASARATAVFRSAFTAEAAREVAGATPAVLRHLVDVSLLHPAQGRRLRMHPMLADHARGAWTDEERIHLVRRHRDHYLHRLVELREMCERSDPEAALEAFDAESDDLEAAWRQATEDGAWETLGAAVDSLFGLADLRGRLLFAETLLSFAIERAEEGGGAPPGLSGRLRVQRGRTRHRLGRLAAALDDLVTGLERVPETDARPDRAAALNALGDVMAALGRYDEARRFCEEALTRFRERQDAGGVAATLTNLGVIAQSRFRLDEARGYHEESLAISREIGDRHGMAHALNNLGAVAHDSDDLEAARELYAQGLETARAAGSPGGAAAALANLGRVEYGRGDLEGARSRSREALAGFVEIGDELGAIACMLNLGDVALATDDHPTAEELFLKALERAVRKEVKPLVGEALIGLAELRRAQGRPAEAAALLAPTTRCNELDPEAIARRNALLADLGEPSTGDEPTSLRQVALATLDSAKEKNHGQGTPLQAHRAGSELSVRGPR